MLKQNALAKNMAFWTETLTDSASSCVWDLLLWLCNQHCCFHRTVQQSCLTPISALRDIFGPGVNSGTVLRSVNNWGISEESLPRRKDSWSPHLSMYFIFWSQSIFFFWFKNPSNHPCGHHVRWEIWNWNKTMAENNVSRVVCLNNLFLTIPVLD